MIRGLVTILASASILGGCASAATPPHAHGATVASIGQSDPAVRLDALAPSIEAFMTGQVQRGFSGVVLVSVPGRQPATWAFSRDANINAQTRFWIGSIVKPMTATAILRLAEEGRLSLQDLLSKFFPNTPADKAAITLEQLLTHSSGLGNSYAAEGLEEADTAAARIFATALDNRSGDAMQYSNDGFVLLGVIVEQVSGIPFDDYLRTSIIDRAGMTQTDVWPVRLGDRTMAPIAARPSAALAKPNWGFRSSTGWSSTLRDMERFARSYFGGDILSPAMVEEAVEPHIRREDARDVGYGWFSEEFGGGRLISHSGAESGLQHFAWLYYFEPSRTVLIVLANSPEEVSAETVDGLVGRLASEQRRSLIRTD